MLLRKTSEIYQVPKSTLHDRVTAKVIFCVKSSLSPYLSSSSKELLNFLLKCSDIGYCHSRKQVIAIVQQIVDEKGIQAVMSDDWWERFFQWNPQITLRAPAPMSYSRAVASDQEYINNYFDLLEEMSQKISPPQNFCPRTK